MKRARSQKPLVDWKSVTARSRRFLLSQNRKTMTDLGRAMPFAGLPTKSKPRHWRPECLAQFKIHEVSLSGCLGEEETKNENWQLNYANKLTDFDSNHHSSPASSIPSRTVTIRMRLGGMSKVDGVVSESKSK